MSIIKVKNITFRYTQTDVLKAVSFEVQAGSFLGIAGPNGAGKTTLLNLLCGLLKPKSGSITIDNVGITSYKSEKLAKKVAVVRQEFIPAFGFSVMQTVLMARVPYLGRAAFENTSDKEIATDALNATATFHLAWRQLGELSGGERQRVFIARALAQQTPILLLDEPTSFLDLQHQVGIYDLLKKMQLEKNKTIVAITHDINLAAQYCDKILVLADSGDYHLASPNEAFSPERIEKIFGVTGFSGQLEQGGFFIPLGRYARDSNIATRPQTEPDIDRPQGQ